jgi:hypothetical protein
VWGNCEWNPTLNVSTAEIEDEDRTYTCYRWKEMAMPNLLRAQRLRTKRSGTVMQI